MNPQEFDERFYTSALDGLKAYRRIEFTLRFMEEQGLDPGGTLDEMWAHIEEWIQGEPDRCRALWEYVDDLRLWGRQRTFLFQLEDDYADWLSLPENVEGIAGTLLTDPVYRWDADEPFLAQVGYRSTPDPNHPLLVFKLIENRKFDLVVEKEEKTFEERATSFFIVDMENRHAELKIQELPTGSRRDLREERRVLLELLENYLDFTRMEPISLTPVMDVLLQAPVYTVDTFKLKSTGPEAGPDALPLVKFLYRLLGRSVPMELTGHWECEQDVLGPGQLHFRLSGASDYLGIDGLADPRRIGDLVDTFVDVYRNPAAYISNGAHGPGGPLARGAIDGSMRKLMDHPKSQAVLLSAGAVAASIIWIVAEAVGGYFYDEALNWLLGGLPVAVLTVPVEVAWIIFYYGWRRVWKGFKVLLSLPRPQVWKAFLEVWRSRKE